ncbi:MAG: ATP-binding cassette domain-containing protein [Clostridia bacterium]|nr:ATP-binding cassette domain-containing protein [Clostridia bacterium]
MYVLKEVKYKGILDIKYLEIPENKVTCIIGESGSGKTTLIRILNNLISADSGEITLNGRNLEEMDPIELRRKVIMLSQTPVVFPGSTEENLLIGLKFSGKPSVTEEHLQSALQMVKLNKNLNDDPQKFSGGEKQRLALARALLLEPEILLLDEPSSSLDEETEDFIIRRVVDYIKEKNKTLIMVTHSKKIAYGFGERIIEIVKGKIAGQRKGGI